MAALKPIRYQQVFDRTKEIDIDYNIFCNHNSKILEIIWSEVCNVFQLSRNPLIGIDIYKTGDYVYTVQQNYRSSCFKITYCVQKYLDQDQKCTYKIVKNDLIETVSFYSDTSSKSFPIINTESGEGMKLCHIQCLICAQWAENVGKIDTLYTKTDKNGPSPIRNFHDIEWEEKGNGHEAIKDQPTTFLPQILSCMNSLFKMGMYILFQGYYERYTRKGKAGWNHNLDMFTTMNGNILRYQSKELLRTQNNKWDVICHNINGIRYILAYYRMFKSYAIARVVTGGKDNRQTYWRTYWNDQVRAEYYDLYDSFPVKRDSYERDVYILGRIDEQWRRHCPYPDYDATMINVRNKIVRCIQQSKDNSSGDISVDYDTEHPNAFTLTRHKLTYSVQIYDKLYHIWKLFEVNKELITTASKNTINMVMNFEKPTPAVDSNLLFTAISTSDKKHETISQGYIYCKNNTRKICFIYCQEGKQPLTHTLYFSMNAWGSHSTIIKNRGGKK